MVGTLAPWCANEKWTFWTDAATGKQYAKVEGRERCPAELKKNIAWWFRNDYEQQVPPDYHPDWPEAKRKLWWQGFRNPLQNARLFVWGWADRNYIVDVLEGDPDPMTVQRDDKTDANGNPVMGTQRAELIADNGEVRTWYSYCGPRLVWYSGTQPTGIFGAKFNLR
jgi:hypothetical protein